VGDIVLAGATSGACTLHPTDISGSTVLTLPSVSGTVLTSATGQTLTAPIINGMGSSVITSGTAVASTSGTSIDFTGIPSWAKRITVMFNGVSTNGTSIVQVQIGSTTVTTTGYASTTSSSASFNSATTGFYLDVAAAAAAANLRFGSIVLNLISSNTWVGFGNTGSTGWGLTVSCAGQSPTLGGALDRIRITTVNGTDTFDAGSINILWE